MASVRKKGRYNVKDALDEFLLNQISKSLKIEHLCSLAKDLKISQIKYDRITAANTFTQDEQVHKVSRDQHTEHLYTG